MNLSINLIIPIIGVLIFMIGFCIYSYIGLNDLKNYGYVGDACQKVKWTYIVISLIVIIATIIAFFII